MDDSGKERLSKSKLSLRSRTKDTSKDVAKQLNESDLKELTLLKEPYNLLQARNENKALIQNHKIKNTLSNVAIESAANIQNKRKLCKCLVLWCVVVLLYAVHVTFEISAIYVLFEIKSWFIK